VAATGSEVGLRAYSGFPHELSIDPMTAAIIGPRTTEHLESQLPAADTVLDEALLDRIDDRPARHDDQPGRRRLGRSGAGAGGTPAVAVALDGRSVRRPGEFDRVSMTAAPSRG